MSRKLDALVAEKVFGYLEAAEISRKIVAWGEDRRAKDPNVLCEEDVRIAQHQHRGARPYSTSIEAAWEVVEKARSLGFQIDIQDVRLDQGPPPQNLWRAHIRIPGAEYWPEMGESAPEAICLAALKACDVSLGEIEAARRE